MKRILSLSLSMPSHDCAYFQGEIVDREYHGDGMYTWPDGSSFSGPFLHNKYSSSYCNYTLMVKILCYCNYTLTVKILCYYNYDVSDQSDVIILCFKCLVYSYISL